MLLHNEVSLQLHSKAFAFCDSRSVMNALLPCCFLHLGSPSLTTSMARFAGNAKVLGALRHFGASGFATAQVSFRGTKVTRGVRQAGVVEASRCHHGRAHQPPGFGDDRGANPRATGMYHMQGAWLVGWLLRRLCSSSVLCLSFMLVFGLSACVVLAVIWVLLSWVL